MRIIDQCRDDLHRHLLNWNPPPTTPAPSRDPYVLVSALQKSLRRHDRDVVLAASRSLLEVDPHRFWRRLVICVFEDFGRSDLAVTANIVAAASDKAWRRGIGGEWHVASFLLDQLSATTADRFLDEIATLGTALAQPQIRADWRSRPASPRLRGLVATVTDLMGKCQTAVPKRSGFSILAGASEVALQRMRDGSLVDDVLYAVCSQGRRTSQCILPVLFPVVFAAIKYDDLRAVETIELPPVRSVGGVPSYAFDGYTRLGRLALADLLNARRDLGQLLTYLKPSASRVDALQGLLFDVEGGLADRALTHPLLEELKTFSVGCASGLIESVRDEGLTLMRALIPELNAIRAEFSVNAQDAA